MPNTGKPSKDCHLCRKRRVKCDLARPSCQRCVKYGAECPGYRDQQDLMFRDANPAQQAQAKRSRKREKRVEAVTQSATPLSSSSSSSSSSSPSPSSFSLSVSSTPVASQPVFTNDFDVPTFLSASSSPSGDYALVPANGGAAGMTLARPLYEHWTAHSVPILMNVYSTLDFLGSLYKAYPADGPLVWAAHLFSRTYVTNLRYPTATSLAARRACEGELGGYLGKTLSSVSEALRARGGKDRDDVLATIWILSNYELLVGSLGGTRPISPWHLHTRGMYSILQARGRQALSTETGRGTFWSAHSMVQIQCVLMSTAPPPESDEWLAVIKGEHAPDEEVPLLVSEYINAACREMALMSRIIQAEDHGAAAAEHAGIAARLDAAKAAADAGFGRLREVYEADALGTYWRMLYASTMVKAYHVAHGLVNLVTHGGDPAGSPLPREQHRRLMERRARFVATVRCSAEEILDHVPAVLEPLTSRGDRSPATLFNALKMVWPVTAVYTMPSTTAGQKARAEEALMFVGGRLGVRQALATYPGFGREWPPGAMAPRVREGEGEGEEGWEGSENVEFVSRLGQADGGWNG